MSHASLPLLLLASLPLAGVQAQLDSFAPCSGFPRIAAVIRADNDVSFSAHTDSPIGIPLVVQNKIHALAAEACFHLRAYSSDTLALAQFYAGVFAIRSPNGFSVFVFDRTNELGVETYFFMLYDSTSNRLTPEPAAIYAKWARDDDGVCERPFVAFEDLDHDGHNELVVRERTHNGSSYNACVRHYYNVEPDLSLSPMLAVEERSLQDELVSPNTWLLRRVRFISSDSLTIATFVSAPGHPEQEVGEVLLSRHPTAHYAGGGYQLADTRVLDPKYKDSLVTDSPNHDANFILTGYTVWY